MIVTREKNTEKDWSNKNLYMVES